MNQAMTPTSSAPLSDLRTQIRSHLLVSDEAALKQLMASDAPSAHERAAMVELATKLIKQVREGFKPGLMDAFLAEYGLETNEGIALMTLAESLLRVPDASTVDELIEDKIVSGQWRSHLGRSSSALVNSSTVALLITGQLLAPPKSGGTGAMLKNMFKNLGEPVVRMGAGNAMREMGRQFVLGTNIDKAMSRAKAQQDKGYTYSYDMLGEAARTHGDAMDYLESYERAIEELATSVKTAKKGGGSNQNPEAQKQAGSVRDNPGISVKLSALHPRYEFAKREEVLPVLVQRTLKLVLMAREANLGFNIDAEEADRLDFSLDIIEQVLSDERLAGWEGFGVVVQAFSQRAPYVLDWLYALSQKLDRRIMVRLVKGAYWDTEIKRAQVMGLTGFPVYTQKHHTDVSYLCCVRKLLTLTDRIYPQFATHNANTISAVISMADSLGVSKDAFEFQRLHGMGEAMHDLVHREHGTRCRIYAPVGTHKELLAYLVRRLLENGANSSFVNQLFDESVSASELSADPIEEIEAHGAPIGESTVLAKNIYAPTRGNSTGYDLSDPVTVDRLLAERGEFAKTQWYAGPLVADSALKSLEQNANAGHSSEAPNPSTDAASDTDLNKEPVTNPTDLSDTVGYVTQASSQIVTDAISAAEAAFEDWSQTSPAHRADLLDKAADLFEEHTAEFFALAAREAGKTLADAVAEVREAVDFARYYAEQIRDFDESTDFPLNIEGMNLSPRGVIVCISPWNFPLAIFSGQIFAALASGNTVVAKPAEQTPLIAHKAAQLMLEAGFPSDVVQFVPGTGKTVGAALSADSRVAGVCFTGSLPTARAIEQSMGEHMAPNAALIAETGGLNAMIVDSTALPEQVVRDVVASAFQSAGQRCSALRMLYVQEDIYKHLLAMLIGAMDELKLGDPLDLSTDVGPVIDAAALKKIEGHIDEFDEKGQLLKSLEVPKSGHFARPSLIRVSGIEELAEEIFGPVLHIATFKAGNAPKVIEAINAKGYGLTFGLHSRMESAQGYAAHHIYAGNIYINRNQIGAIVGSQPFGGEGLSGTGPKAGGPLYLKRLMSSGDSESHSLSDLSLGEQREGAKRISSEALAKAIVDIKPERKQKPKASVPLSLGDFYEACGYRSPSLMKQVRLLPGPTGETNRWSLHPRGLILCLGPDAKSAYRQAALALSTGNSVLIVAPDASSHPAYKLSEGLPLQVLDGWLEPDALKNMQGVAAVSCNSSGDLQQAYRRALGARDGAIIPLIHEVSQPDRYQVEKHLCVDTTAAGGNTSLIAQS